MRFMALNDRLYLCKNITRIDLGSDTHVAMRNSATAAQDLDVFKYIGPHRAHVYLESLLNP